VQQFKSKPFVLLGVNSDPREKLDAIMKNQTVTWRSFWDGGDPRGPIAREFNVMGWPMVYVIDRKGKIQFKGHHEEVDDLLAKLVDEK
jgi:hypothetical protein